jgi:branched-chain amino acid transport system ATP-binding protein
VTTSTTRADTTTQPLATLELDGVTVRFGGLVALDDVSFDVHHGEIVGLIGPNGAGKTTAFNVACGFVRPTSGEVHYPASGHSSLRPHQLARAGIARTLQGVGLFENMSVLENVMAGAQSRPGGRFAASFFGIPSVARNERRLRQTAMESLHRLGIADVAARLPSSIPYGTAKKVSVARALINEPRLLLLDEPASGLDERELEEFAELIASLRTSMGLLLVEHNMDFVMPLVQRLVVLNFGEVIARGTPAQVRDNPDVLAAYLGVDQ